MSERFSLTPLFEGFLETIVVEWREGDPLNPSLLCSECSDVLCDVETDDTLGVLVRTALAHDAECQAQERNIQPGATGSTTDASSNEAESESTS